MQKKIILLLILFPTLFFAQNKISGTFSPAAEYEWVLLYKLTANDSEFIEKTEINDDGKFELALDKKYDSGMYKLVYKVPQDRYNFDFIYNAQEDIEFTFSEEQGLEYLISNENKLMNSYTKSMGMVSQSIGSFYKQQSTDSTALVTIFETLKNTQEEYENSADGTLASNFINANRPYLPEGYESVDEYVANIREHYFDHVDFNNELLQSSTFLIERTLNFVFGMSGEGNTDSERFINNTKELSVAMKGASPETQKTIYSVLWQQLADANYEDVANFISETYLLDLARKTKDQPMEEELIKYSNLSTGKPAPDFDIVLTKDGQEIKTKLSELNTSKYYILAFWSSLCSHCLEEMPKLQTYVSNYSESDLKVVAFALEDDENRWEEETAKLDKFIHVKGLGKWENEIGNVYNVTATPTYYVLDENKKILAKPVNFQELMLVFQ